MPKGLKEKAEALFKRLGLDMSTAIRIFFVQVVRCGRIPFEISLEEKSLYSSKRRHKKSTII